MGALVEGNFFCGPAAWGKFEVPSFVPRASTCYAVNGATDLSGR
jgi:hypothetical protein